MKFQSIKIEKSKNSDIQKIILFLKLLLQLKGHIEIITLHEKKFFHFIFILCTKRKKHLEMPLGSLQRGTSKPQLRTISYHNSDTKIGHFLSIVFKDDKTYFINDSSAKTKCPTRLNNETIGKKKLNFFFMKELMMMTLMPAWINGYVLMI